MPGREPSSARDGTQGKISNKSEDKWLYYAGRLGIEAKVRFRQTNKQVVRRELAAATR